MIGRTDTAGAGGDGAGEHPDAMATATIAVDNIRPFM
jgi:hypothetical protein